MPPSPTPLHPLHDFLYCPHCGSFEKTILTGKDFLIREIHVPE